jgi:hypothetical protein
MAPLGAAVVGVALLLAWLGGGFGGEDDRDAMPRFESSFEAGNWREWGGYGGDHDPEDYPPARIVDPKDEGVPRLDGRRAARLEVTAEDARVDRVHAKLIRSWPVSEVSGTYSAWYYLDPDYRLRPSGWVNIFQFKEPYRCDDYCSDPSWWMILDAPEDGDRVPYPGAPVATIDRWDEDGRAELDPPRRPFPTGRWVEVRAELHQGDRIEFFIDGEHFATARDEQYPVGPMHGDRSLEWAWGVGNYAGNGDGPEEDATSGPMYVDRVSFEPFDDGWWPW